MSNYYFEPSQQPMTSDQVSLNIGSVVNSWSTERQMEIGLFPAEYMPIPPYGIYTQKVDGFSWVKIEAGSLPPDPFFTTPYYKQVWNIVDMTSGEQSGLLSSARELVAQEIEDRLASINNWASSRHVVNTSWPVPQSVKNYINNLLALNTENEDYPYVLADGVHLKTYIGWPTRLTAYQIQQLVDPT
jgi:hypothetical protein